jgi:uridylate kinase
VEVAALAERPGDGRRPVFARVILKLGGEALLGSAGYGIDYGAARHIAEQLTHIVERGVQVAIVVGGGNIVRGTEAAQHGIDRVTADYMGMLATVINALALRDAIEQFGIDCRLQSAIAMQQVAEPFIPRRAIRHLEKGRLVILAAGTGNPFFTTDTTAALRAVEIGADVLLKATKVDGIYSADPKKDKNATFYHDISYDQVIREELKVMDLTAFAMCKQQKIPLVVFNMKVDGNIARVVCGDRVGTRITPE